VGHGDERDLPVERGPEAGLVGRVGIGVQEADGHRLDAERAERRRQGRQLVLRERHGDPAVGEDALRHLEPEVAGHERRRPRRDVEPVERHTSKWQDYMNPRHDFDMNYVWKKELFVRQALNEFRARRVLDVGCNTGYFSRSAARVGATVVAIDRDPAVVGHLWREVHSDGADILPLVVDFARPSPSVGWRNSENLSFLERAHGSFDLLLMLAIVHHLLVSERIPLEEILGLAADLTSDLLVIEFVAPDDPMFTTLTRGRESLFDKLTNESFREACTKRFHIIRSQQLDPKSRWLYLLKRK